jgi:hypothetical protein
MSKNNDQPQEYRKIDKFDNEFTRLKGTPEAIKSKPTTIVTHDDLVSARQFTIQTIRQHEKGDTIFLTCLDCEGAYRIIIPPKVANAIARQREALTVAGRRIRGKRNAAERKARGELPGFMRNNKAKKQEAGDEVD